MKTNKVTLGVTAILCAGLLMGIVTAQVKPRKLTVWAEGGVVDTMVSDPSGKGRYGLTLKQLFEKEHPGVTVELMNMGWDEQLRQNLTNAMLAGNAPDVIVGEGFFKNYASLGALLPIDISKMKSNMVLGTVQGSTYNNKVYGLAGFTSVFGFERNCAVIKQAGLNCDKAPQTWDDLLAQAKTITEKGAGKVFGATIQGPGTYALGAAFRNYVYLLQSGADMSKPGAGGLDVPAFNDPKAVKAYEFLRELNKYTPPGLSFESDEGKLYSQLFAGVSAYQMAGGWHVSWAKENKCADCRYSAPPLPAGGKPASVIVANVIYGALKTSKNPTLATDFVKFTQRDEVQSLVFASTGRLPTTRSALKALKPKVDSATQAFVDTLLNSSNLNAMPQWEKNPQKIWQAYTDFLSKLYTTTTPVPALLEELQKNAETAAK